MLPSRCARIRANLGRSFVVDSVASRSADLFRRQAKLQVQLRNLPLRRNHSRNRILLTRSSHLTLRAKARGGFRWGWHIRLRDCDMLQKNMPPFCMLLFLLVAASHRDHQGSPVRGIGFLGIYHIMIFNGLDITYNSL